MFYVNQRSVCDLEKIGVVDTSDNSTDICTKEEINEYKQMGIPIAFLSDNNTEMSKDYTFDFGKIAFCIRGSSLYYATDNSSERDLSGLVLRDDNGRVVDVPFKRQLSEDCFLFCTTVARDKGAYLEVKNYAYLVSLKLKCFDCVAEMENYVQMNSIALDGLSEFNTDNYRFGNTTINIPQELARMEKMFG